MYTKILPEKEKEREKEIERERERESHFFLQPVCFQSILHCSATWAIRRETCIVIFSGTCFFRSTVTSFFLFFLSFYSFSLSFLSFIMATSSGIVTRSRAKVLQTTITPYISDEEEETKEVSSSKQSSSVEEPALNLDKQVNVDPKNETVSNEDVPEGSLPEPGSDALPESSRMDTDKVFEIDNNIDGVVRKKSEPSTKKSEPSTKKSEPCIPVLDPSKESKAVVENGVNGFQHSSSGSAASVKEAIEVVLKGKASKQFDHDYEDDGFVLKAKRKSGDKASNGHVLAVEPIPGIDDADVNRINFLFGEYEYEDRDGPKDESEEESILSDPSDLNEESEPEGDEDLIEDDIEDYGKDRPRRMNCFIDDEALVDNASDDEALVDNASDEDHDLVQPQFSSDDSDEDRAIRAPLKKKDFLDEEAVEDNNLKSLYGWTDCTSSEDESKGRDWEWNHDPSDSEEKDGESEDEGEEDGESEDEGEEDGESEDEGEEDGESGEESYDETDEDQEALADEEDERFIEDETRSSKSSIILHKGCLDSSDEEDGENRRQKRRPKVIEDEEENETVCEDEVQVVGQVKNSSHERKNVSAMETNLSPQKTIRKNASPKRSLLPDLSPKKEASSSTDIVIQSTSSVFIVTPLKANYQPGRSNKQIFNITPLETNVSSSSVPASQAGTNVSSSHRVSSQNSAPKRGRSENDVSQEVICKKVKSCNIPDDFILGHDLVFIINSSSLKSGSRESDVSKGIEKLTSILKKALEDRVTVIGAKTFEGTDSSVIGAKTFGGTDSSVIAIGLNLNVDRAYECVVKGPSADQSQEVKRFKKLWGNKAEIRRYPDLSILVSVYFEAKTLAERRDIVPKIVRYIVSLHFKIDPSEILVYDQAINCVLTPKRQALGTGEEELLSVSESFERLKKKLRELKDLPLGVCSVRAISPVFRGAEVFPPQANLSNKVTTCKTSKSAHGCLLMAEDLGSIPALVKPQEVVIELETSGKWPDDLAALRQVTTQILYNFMAQLHLKYKLPVRLSESFLDVLHDSIVFRIHIAVKKEIILLRQFQSNSGLMLAKRGQVPEADDLEMRNEFLPVLTSALNGVSTQFVVYNTVVRLAKRWLSSQYLWTLVSELVIELLVARVFLSPSDRGYSGPPHSPLVGFMRFLELVSRFKWEKEPLFVDLNNELAQERKVSITKSFQQMKVKPAFLICTPYDVVPGVFSKSNGMVNSRPVFDTFVRNCRSTLNCLMQMIRGSEPFNFLKLFQHPTEDYHVIILLKHEFVATSTQTLDPSMILSSNKKKTMENSIPVTDFDVVEQYLHSLRIRYEKEAVFFHDHFGGTKILVTFTPETLNKFSERGSSYEKVIENFDTLAHGIVKEIKVNADKWT